MAHATHHQIAGMKDVVLLHNVKFTSNKEHTPSISKQSLSKYCHPDTATLPISLLSFQLDQQSLTAAAPQVIQYRTITF